MPVKCVRIWQPRRNSCHGGLEFNYLRNKKKNMIISCAKFVALLILFSAGLLSSCAEFKDAGRTIGHTARNVTWEIGHGSRDVAKDIGYGTRRGVKTIGQGTKNVVKSLSDHG
jgi:hypothetical protein